MKNFLKKKNNKVVLGGIAILVFGIFVGYQLNGGALNSIGSFLLNAIGYSTGPNATSPNATSSNATAPNATSPNATSPNATAPNATSSNANITDNILYLESFDLGKFRVTQNWLITLKYSTIGAYNSAASLTFENDYGTSFTVSLDKQDNFYYFVIPNYVIPSTYHVASMLLIGQNSNGTTFSKLYTKNDFDFNAELIIDQDDYSSSAGVISDDNNNNQTNSNDSNKDDSNKESNSKNDNNDLNNIINVPKKEIVQVVLNNISLESTSSKVNEKVYLNVYTNEKLNSLKLVFKNNIGKTFTAYAKELTGTKPYFIIPTSVEAGAYTLSEVIVATPDSSAYYTKDGSNGTQKFNFNSNLEVIAKEETNNDIFVYNNEEMSSDILTKLYSAPEGTEIEINADYSPLINEELFNTIKGKDKKITINFKNSQIIFNGKDIVNSKTIDVSMSIISANFVEKINNLVDNGTVVKFPDNGNLPGKALVRIKDVDGLGDNVFVYLFNESTNKFSLINDNVKKLDDGYYEFIISHNSSYLIVDKKLDDKLISNDSDNVVSFQKNNKNYLLILGLAAVIILAVGISVIVIKMKNDKKKAIK